MPILLFTMAICIVVAVFALQNSLVVPVKFIFFEQEASLVLVILIAAFLGLLIGMTIIMYVKFKNYFGTKKLNDKIKSLTDENTLLTQQVASLETRLHGLEDASNKAADSKNVSNGENQPEK